MAERYAINTTTWRGLAQVTTAPEGVIVLTLLIDVGDGKPPMLHKTLEVERSLRESIKLLAKAWESGKVAFQAFALAPEVAATADRLYFAEPTYAWHLPHPRYSFEEAVFAYGIHAGVVPEDEIADAKRVDVSVSRVQRARGRDGLMWSCTLLVSGKPAAEVSDDGNGGEIDVHVRNPALFRLAQRYAAATAHDRIVKVDSLDVFDAGIGHLAGRLCDDFELAKDLQKKVMFTDPATGQTLTLRGKFTTVARDRIVKDYPNAIILNETIGKQTAVEMLPEEADPGYYKRRCKTITIFRTEAGGGIREMKTPFSARVKAHVLTKYPDAVFFNETIAGQPVDDGASTDTQPQARARASSSAPASAGATAKYPAGAVVTFKDEGSDARGPFGPVKILKDASFEALSKPRKFGAPDPNQIEDLGWLPKKEAKKLAQTHKLKFIEL